MRNHGTIFLLLVVSLLAVAAGTGGDTKHVSCAFTQIRKDVVKETHIEEENHFTFKKSFGRIIDDYFPALSRRNRLQKRSLNACTLPTVPKCNFNYKYRNISGACNNMENPSWGMALICQNRLIPADYDGFSSIRKASDGEPLPDSRNISVSIYTDVYRPSHKLSHLAMFFGQLCAHDMTLTSENQQVSGEALNCCQIEDDNFCYVIDVPKNDYFFSKYNITCLNYVRAANCNNTCDNAKKQVFNMETSFLDASFIYGTSNSQAASLRSNDETGTMRTQTSQLGEEILPKSSDPTTDQCSVPSQNEFCFEAGDPRVNQHTVVTCLQTICMRYHNYIATELKRINPQWDGEQLYQETRRIVSAQLQHIYYSELLPIILNNKTIQDYDIGVSEGFTTYDPTVDPTMSVEFSGAAFREFHSMVNTRVAIKPLNVTQGYTEMRDLFFRPFGLYYGRCDPLLVSTTIIAAQKNDRHEVVDMTDYLYRVPGNITGNDIAATDINRGRDIGLSPYITVLKYCSGIEIKSFKDLTKYKLMCKEHVNLLKRNYENVKDVDLEPGLLLEDKLPGSIVGNTTACIMGIQFRKLKYGDRFYYTHGGQVGSFTEPQLMEIKVNTSLATIFCQTTTEIKALPMNPMVLASKRNPLIPCTDRNALNLELWKE